MEMTPESPSLNAPVQPEQPKKSRSWIAIVIVVLLLVGAAVALFFWNNDREQANVEAAEISITAGGVTPATVKVAAGTTVSWVNNDDQKHQIKGDSDASQINSGEDLLPGDTYQLAFEEKGTFTYYDPLDPNGIKGTVIVE